MLRLGVHGLMAAEAGLVRALVALLRGGRDDLQWVYAEQGPCDALVADVADPSRLQAQRARGARALLLLSDRAGGSEDLTRPLRADGLCTWLLETQRRIGLAEPEVQPAAPEAAPAPEPEAVSARWRLRRWPPAEFLQGQPARVRMATLLSRRALSARQLAVLTSQEEAECRRFLDMLQGFRLLEPEAPAIRQAPKPPPPAGWDLVRSIRRRLGL